MIMAENGVELPRPASVPDVHKASASSSRPSLIVTLEPYKTPSGTNVPSSSNGTRHKSRRQRTKQMSGPNGTTV